MAAPYGQGCFLIRKKARYLVSNRDKALVESLGLSVAQVAGVLAKSRQTVNRGIRADGDYFKVPDLAKVLGRWRKSDAELYFFAKDNICRIYPELAASILRAIEESEIEEFSPDVAGEYWFVCGDYIGFRNNLSNCSDQIDILCMSDDSQLKIFVSPRDILSVQRQIQKYPGKNTQFIPCSKVDLSLIPSTLLRLDMNDNMDLFGASDKGFVPLSRQEAARLRVAIHDLLLRDVQEPIFAEGHEAN